MMPEVLRLGVSTSGHVMLPGEVGWGDSLVPVLEPGVLTLDPGTMLGVATKAMAAAPVGMTAVGIASLQHGQGATSVARALSMCLAQTFGKRVVLVEANQRSACLRRVYGLPDGPGLGDVLARRVSLGGALQMAGEHRRIVVLPASVREAGALTASGLRDVLLELLGYVDAAVIDLAPIVPYKDTAGVCSALDGVVLVMQGGRASVADGKIGVARVKEAGGTILGAILNRERK